MSRTHGFRIYLVQVFANQAANKDALKVTAGSNVHKRIVQLMGERHDGDTVFQSPRPSKDGEPARPVMTTTFGPIYPVRSDFVHTVIEMGEQGSHRRAVKRGSAPQDIEEWSAEMGYRLGLIFPDTAGTTFVIVAETIRGRDALKRFLALLTSADLVRKKNHISASEGVPQSERTAYTRLVFRAEQAPDEAYLNEILGSAKSASAVFKSTAASARGKRRVITRKLSIELRDASALDVVRDQARTWLEKQREDHARTHAEGVSDLAAQLEALNQMVDGESSVYDEATISVVSEGGDRTNIATDTLRDVFTYPVSDGRPSNWFFYNQVSPRLRSVALENSLRLARIDPSEVAEWLEGSTSVP